MTATLREVIKVLDTAYPPSLAESWDSVGLVAGDPGNQSPDGGSEWGLVPNATPEKGSESQGGHPGKAGWHRIERG